MSTSDTTNTTVGVGDSPGGYYIRSPYIPTPDIDEINSLYAEGKIDGNQLDMLQDAALEAYPPDGRRSGRERVSNEVDRGRVGGLKHNTPIVPILVGVFVGVILTTAVFAAFPEFVEWLFSWEIRQPGVVPV